MSVSLVAAHLEEFKNLTAGISSVITAAAVILGGWWTNGTTTQTAARHAIAIAINLDTHFEFRHNGFSTATLPWFYSMRCSTWLSVVLYLSKEVVGIHVLLIRSLFGADILRRLLRRVSRVKPTSAPLRF
jgi:hypothetical protein